MESAVVGHLGPQKGTNASSSIISHEPINPLLLEQHLGRQLIQAGFA
jgi:hypothetical protein